MTQAPRRTALLAAAILATTALASAPPTTAAPTWLQPPAPVSDASFTSFDQQVVVDGSGNATAVWTTYVPAAGGTPAHYVITSAYLAAGGTWSAPSRSRRPLTRSPTRSSRTSPSPATAR